jgi:hypothetical protein
MVSCLKFCFRHNTYCDENVKCSDSLHGIDNLGDTHLFWKIILKLILEKNDEKIWQRSLHNRRGFLDWISCTEAVIKMAS